VFEIEATVVESVFDTAYKNLFGFDPRTSSAADMSRPLPNAIFILNLDKVMVVKSYI
jgi:hypothetical protein